MPTIINPWYRGSGDPGAAISRAAAQIFGGDKIGPAIKREQLRAAQRANVETENVMRSIANGDPVDWATVGPALVGSGYDPQDFNILNRGRSAGLYGATDPRTRDAQIGAGQSYSDTAEGFNIGQATTRRGQDISSADRRYATDADLAEKRRQFDRGLVEVQRPDGSFGFVPRSAIPGSDLSPVVTESEIKGSLLGENFERLGELTPEQRAVLGAEPKIDTRTAKNYLGENGQSYQTFDGLTDARSGAPLPPGAIVGVEGTPGDIGLQKSTITDLEKSIVTGRVAKTTIGMMRQLTETDPTLFGAPGYVRGKLQEVNEAFKAVFGGTEGYNQALTQAQVAAARNPAVGQLIPGLYDRNLPAVQMLGNIMLYQLSAALAGQEGRSVSDKDVELMMEIIGDPQGLFSSAQSTRARLDMAERIIDETTRLAQAALQAGQPVEGSARAAFNNIYGQGQGGGPSTNGLPANGQSDGSTGTLSNGVQWRMMD